MSKLKKGDKVKIMLGKDRGKEGTVEYFSGKDKRAFVGGANLYKRHVKKGEKGEGGIVDIPKPIDLSNLALICPACNKTTRIGYQITDNKKVRICKKCKKEIK